MKNKESTHMQTEGGVSVVHVLSMDGEIVIFQTSSQIYYYFSK